MARVNENFIKLSGNYLFAEIARRKSKYLDEHPGKVLINMGIGDVTRPLFPSVVSAMHKAADEMAAAETFRGYPPYQGYDFLLERIAENDFPACSIAPDEIFVSDGAKSDCANIGELFSSDSVVAVCDPVYPVYVDSTILGGRAGEYDESSKSWSQMLYLPCTRENGFVPDIPKQKADLIYLCYPNNPTGAVASAGELQKWVDYANANDAVILFDAAYEAYITTPGIPHSIFEIPGAKTCAIEFRSFSKTAGFTGTRCAYAAVPKELVRSGVVLRDLWLRRQSTKFNGVSYIVQRGAEAVYSEQGRQELKETLAYYQRNAQIIRSILDSAGTACFGGIDSPYVWLRLPEGLDSWEAFDMLLTRAGVVTTPGSGFGKCGEGYLRVTAFGTPEDTRTAAGLIADVLR